MSEVPPGTTKPRPLFSCPILLNHRISIVERFSYRNDHYRFARLGIGQFSEENVACVAYRLRHFRQTQRTAPFIRYGRAEFAITQRSSKSVTSFANSTRPCPVNSNRVRASHITRCAFCLRHRCAAALPTVVWNTHETVRIRRISDFKAIHFSFTNPL